MAPKRDRAWATSAAAPKNPGPIYGILGRLARAQVERPWRFVLACLLLSSVATLLASRLQLRTRFEQLLPEARPSVVELARLEEQVRTGSHIFVVVEGGARDQQRAFGDELVAELRVGAPPWLVACDDGAHEARAFLAPRAGMFAKLADLERLRDDVEARWDFEIAKATDTNLDDDEPPPALTWTDVRRRFGLPEAEQFPDGYYQAHDGRALIVKVDTTVASGDLSAAQHAIDYVRERAEALRHTPKHAQLELAYAGDLVTGLSEYSAAVQDLLHVGALGLGLLVLVSFFFFLRLRALLALGTALSVGLSWTFGIAQLTIGHLNIASGFLVSIVAGNGINFGIIYVARVYEEMRRGQPLVAAIESSIRLTRRATLAAALAATAAYASLGISEFRAFRHFALIGGVGMLACWLAMFMMLPSVLLIVERARPLRSLTNRFGRETLPSSGQHYGAPLASITALAPRLLTLSGVAIAAVGVLSLLHYVRSDPMEYNMRRMQNDLGESGDMYRASKIAAEIMGAKLDGAMILLADRPDQVPLIKQALQARWDAAPQHFKPFEAVHAAFDFVPPQQAEKLPLLQQIRARVSSARRRGLVSEQDFAKLEPFLPPAELATWTIADLPPSMARPFEDKAGIVGRLVLIEPTAGQSDSDVKYLMRWADSFRELPLANGEVVHGSGRAVIFADILSTVLHDIPRTVAFSLAMTLGAVLLTFRRSARSILVIAALAVGLGFVALAVSLLDIKINFFNFVALPISFGIGVDYAVNFVLRYEQEPHAGALNALRKTGGAILLCSLTTMLGYLALLGSVNQAIRSLGLLAALGEIGCLVAATLVLPSYLYWRELSDTRRAATSAASDAPI